MKNKITKLGTITALGLLLLVGGVYASWDYANGKATSSTANNTSLHLANATTTGTKGTLSSSGTVSFYFDDSDDDFYGELVIETNSFNVSYAPSSTVETNVKENGIDLEVTFTNEYSDYQFANVEEAVQFVTFGSNTGKCLHDTNLEVTSNTGKEITFTIPSTSLTKDSSGNFSYTLSNELFASIFKVATDSNDKSVVYLPTYADYEAFSTGISGKFTITVSEKTSSSSDTVVSQENN